MISYIAALVFCYLIGSISGGAIVAKAYGVKLSDVGSGNIGATNAARTLGKAAGLLTLFVDLLKGLAAYSLGFYFFEESSFASWCALTCIAGHCFRLPGMKGGKGVATYLGGFLILTPLGAVIGLLVFCALVAVKKIVSLASISGVLIAPVVALMDGTDELSILPMGLAALLVVTRHRENLERLVQGKEKRFSYGR